ncbi:carboxylesterase family protein [Amycolatopsis rhizosphaerae]|uniref:Carboxylesterase family protein n=1 Tax=Amycolatopsis rhizosphaerae TaxID=2053003 RepID=A0A558D6H4_9PSEU|nr:carboxylesterase family protein [Amycolatopsis rhizosphaerae]TVT56608.1 carboxylesterase family protein [Amycolatopsis rhizosphaerae]
MGESQLLAVVKRRFDDPEGVLAGYRDRFPGESPGALTTRITTDAFTESNRRLARAHRGAGNPVHGYEFAWRSPAFGGRLGACHCAELPFVFDRLDLPDLYGAKGLLGADPPDQELAKRMHTAWVGFVTHGDPGWPVGESRTFRTRKDQAPGPL